MSRRITLFLVLLFGMVAGMAVAAEQPKEEKFILIQHVNIFDGTSETLSEGQDVLIKGNRIENIGENITPPAGATVIDGNGRTLTPGFIDAHTHLQWNWVSLII
jgi:imidazolonepropionase-like amidohydrolase